METINVTIRLDKETVAFLDGIAKHDERDRSYVIRRAIRNFVEMQQWQLEDIRQAIKEADAGDFATDEEVAKLFGKWTSSGGILPQSQISGAKRPGRTTLFLAGFLACQSIAVRLTYRHQLSNSLDA